MEKLQFGDLNLSVIKRDNQLWLTTQDIAQALYYKGSPQSEAPFEKRVRNLYARHSEEFTASMTALVDMQTKGGIQKVRIFSLRGAHLLGMLARTERAKEFRRWALDVLESHVDSNQAILTEYHKTLAEYAQSKANASICGRGLSQWRKLKTPLETKMDALGAKIQPDLLVGMTQ